MDVDISSFVNEGLGHSLPDHLPVYPTHGAPRTERAMTGASVLERRSHRDIAVLRGGYTAWSARHGTTAAR